MSQMLETLSWVAAIIAVPVVIVGWFVPGAGRSDKSAASETGTAISGDMNVDGAGVVARHNSHVRVSFADIRNAERYERRYAVFQAVGNALTSKPEFRPR